MVEGCLMMGNLWLVVYQRLVLGSSLFINSQIMQKLALMTKININYRDYLVRLI